MDKRHAEVRAYVEEHEQDLFRAFPFAVEELRDSGNGIPGSYAIKGLASVYNKWSLNLGGFREQVKPGAFDEVLATDPHVLHTWDHDTSKPLSSTRSKKYPLELKSQREGLGFYSRVAPTTDAANLRILMEGDVIDQSSFAFIPGEAEWRFIEEEDMLERTIITVEGLYDVTTCAMGAYPQTESEIAVRSLLRAAPQVAVYFSGTAPLAASTTTNSSFATRTSGGEGNAEPAAVLAPEPPEEPPAEQPAAPEEGEEAPAQQPEPPAEEQPEDREAREREFRLWQQKRAAEHRRTREFAYGVLPQKEEK